MNSTRSPLRVLAIVVMSTALLVFAHLALADDAPPVVHITVNYSGTLLQSRQNLDGGDDYLADLVRRLLDTGYTVAIDRSWLTNKITDYESLARREPSQAIQEFTRRNLQYLRACLQYNTLRPSELEPQAGFFGNYALYRNPLFLLASPTDSANELTVLLVVGAGTTPTYSMGRIRNEWLVPDVSVRVERRGHRLADRHIDKDLKSSFASANSVVVAVHLKIASDIFNLIREVAPLQELKAP